MYLFFSELELEDKHMRGCFMESGLFGRKMEALDNFCKKWCDMFW